MRVLVIVKANKKSEAGEMPSERMLTEMMKFNEELVNAGIMEAGEGVHPSAKGVRIHLGSGAPRVEQGPFAATEELLAGFWIWKVKSFDEAIEWAKRVPNPSDGDQGVLELRPIFEAEDFGEELTPELRAKEDELRERVGKAGAP